MRKLFESRVAAVSVGAAVIVGLGSTGAWAAATIGSDEIRNGGVSTVDIRDGGVQKSDVHGDAVGSHEVKDGTLGLSDLRASTRRNLEGERGERGPRGRRGVSGLDASALNTVGHLLYGSPDQSTTVTYELETPIKLSEFDLTFFQERVLGAGGYGASLLLGVDVDGNGGYESDDEAWANGPSSEALGDDTFVAMDGANPDTVKVVARDVNRWWSPNAAGDGMETVDSDCYNTLPTLVESCENVKFDENSTVELVRFTMGGTVAWTDEAVRFTVLDERLKLVNED